MTKLKQLKKYGSKISILYVEDDADLRDSISTYLHVIFDSVDVAQNGAEGLESFKSKVYDIVITDIQMPKMNGLKMIKKIREINPNQEILITTAFSQTDYIMDAISLHVNGYILKPIDFDKINLTLYESVNNLLMRKENENYKTNLEDMVQARTEQNTLLEKEKIDNYKQTLLSFVELVEKRDSYTGGHSLRVASYCKLIAQEMGYDKETCELLHKAGVLHDVGKIETPDTVLLKPGRLDDLEYELIKEHVSTGAKLLGKIPMYKELAKIIASHHEKYDGTGYPEGLVGDEIPELTRIMIIADAFDAMTTNRIYKAKMSIADALKELQKFAGTQFDEKVVKAAIKPLSHVVLDKNIGQLPSTQMEEKRFAYFFEDQITQAYNHNYLDLMLIQNSTKTTYITCLFLHNFTAFNKTYGWDKGNIFLKEVVKILTSCSKDSAIFRVYGDDFVIISKSKIAIEESYFSTLLKESEDIVTLSFKELNTKDESINSLRELEDSIK